MFPKGSCFKDMVPKMPPLEGGGAFNSKAEPEDSGTGGFLRKLWGLSLLQFSLAEAVMTGTFLQAAPLLLSLSIRFQQHQSL